MYLTEPGPLAVPSDTLSELMARDPLQLADQDIVKIVEALRAQRAAWQIAEAAGKKSAPKAKTAAGTVDTSAVTSLEDLGL